MIHFDEHDMPTIEISSQDNEEKYDNIVALGLTDGTPMFALASKIDKDMMAAVGLHVDEKGNVNVFLKNENVKGGNIAIRVDDDGGGILMRSNEDFKNESHQTNKGILLVNSSEVTLMDVKGHIIGSKNIQEEKSSSKGESNE